LETGIGEVTLEEKGEMQRLMKRKKKRRTT
jgi:hypothetical protein